MHIFFFFFFFFLDILVITFTELLISFNNIYLALFNNIICLKNISSNTVKPPFKIKYKKKVLIYIEILHITFIINELLPNYQFDLLINYFIFFKLI
ncbi:hypothetical protein H8356DRAFT_58192 [Neocallimastix lanati (nom. inval.)]|nr:hypothetical protein H8356DRAFT_58192 [Neocallimastix sp. JGI-2020a]